MKEDILKFRKLCDILIKEKDMTVNKISIESGITWPTIKKLLETDVNEIRIQASVLGMVQNYLHKHCDTIRLSGIDPLEFPIGTPSQEKASLAGTKVHERLEKTIKEAMPIKEAKKFLRDDKGNVSKVVEINDSSDSNENEQLPKEEIEHIKSGKSTIPEYMFENKKTSGIIEPKNLVQIIVFLRMEAMKYRELANSFDISADQLEKTNLH